MAIPEGYEKLAAIGIAYKGVYAESTDYKYLNAVFYSGSTFVALKDNPVKPPVSDGTNWQYLAQGFVEGVMSAVNATDTSGVIGTAGEEVNAQTLIDAIADRVMTKLVPTSKIVNNLLATDAGTVLAGPQGKALSDSIAEVNSKLSIVGVSYQFSPSAAVTLEPASYKTVISGTLPAGTYLIVSNIGYAIDVMARMDLAESTSSEPFCFTTYGATLTRMVTFTQSTNIQLRCWGQGTVSTDHRINFINAVRLR